MRAGTSARCAFGGCRRTLTAVAERERRAQAASLRLRLSYGAVLQGSHRADTDSRAFGELALSQSGPDSPLT
jgi:hypothetical protein